MKQQVTQFKLKSRQKEILLWLYKFRFLNRPHEKGKSIKKKRESKKFLPDQADDQ